MLGTFNRLSAIQGLVIAYLLALFVIIYGPGVGKGFVADDFNWIARSRPPIAQAVGRALSHTSDFYRPVITFSFAVNYALSGLNPKLYGLVNLSLLIGCAVLVAWLASLSGLRRGFAIFAAALFAFNVHGIDMGVLWISGRTSLFLTLFSLGAAIAFQKGRLQTCAVLTFLALLSKEEAVVLPIVFSIWRWLDAGTEQTAARGSGLEAIRETRWMWAVLGIYAVLRFHSGAMLPTNAPPYYRLSANPHLLARNLREYADRACSISLLFVGLVFLVARVRPGLDARERAMVAKAASWLVLGFAITIFLPIRSSLYAVFPSIGSVLAASLLIAGMWPRVSARTQRSLTAAALMLPIALLPVYRARGERWVLNAQLSDSVVNQLEEVAARPEVERIVLRDDRTTRVNLANAIGPAASDVARLIAQHPLTVEIEPPFERKRRIASPEEAVMALDPLTGLLTPALP